jgi:hypothetical protein
MLQNFNLQNILKAIECGDIETGKGLNQDMRLARPSQTRWSSHYKTILNIVSLYPSICDVLISLGEDIIQKSDWTKI